MRSTDHRCRVLTDSLPGYLLSMSPTTSVSFLDLRMSHWIRKPPHESTNSKEAEDAYVVEFLRQSYKKSGSVDWPSAAANWLFVRILTKCIAVPHGHHSGRTIPEVQKAYIPLVRELVCICVFFFPKPGRCHSITL